MNDFLKKLKENGENKFGKPAIPAVFSQQVFYFLVQREQARADRGHGIFSLIVFKLASSRSSSRKIIDALQRRIRITDSVGYLPDSSIGVLLADTARAGGMVFLNDILPSIKEIQPAPESQIYTYPPDADKTGNSPTLAEQAAATDLTDTEEIINELLARQPMPGRKFLEQVAAGAALLLISPLLIVIAVAIKIQSPGPVFYTQSRIGHKGKKFRCYKFRSMHTNSDTGIHETYFKNLISSDVPMEKMDRQGDSRIFSVGALLRASSLDELPQLFNIAKGEMSVIGPRPSTPFEFKNYLRWHRRRVDTLPGLTGLWQVNGKNKTTFKEMMRFDIRYARHQSIGMNIRIIAKTLPVIVQQYIEDRATQSTSHPSRLIKWPHSILK